MLTPVVGADLERVRPLFDGLPGLHGCLDAALEGGMGAVYVDSARKPRVALIELDFDLLAGDPNAEAAETAVREIERPASIVVAHEGWPPLLHRVWGEALSSRTRVAFRPGRWDRERLRALVESAPEGYELRRIESRDAARFAELADSLVYNFPNLDDFIARGVGFGIEHDGRFVSGCSSFAISPQPRVRDPDAPRLPTRSRRRWRKSSASWSPGFTRRTSWPRSNFARGGAGVRRPN